MKFSITQLRVRVKLKLPTTTMSGRELWVFECRVFSSNDERFSNNLIILSKIIFLGSKEMQHFNSLCCSSCLLSTLAY